MIIRTNPPYGSHNLAVYVNGQRKAATTAPGAHKVYPFGIGNQSQNGRNQEKRGFDGILDEARVFNVEKDDTWAKLDYESQREGSKFVEFGPIKTSLVNRHFSQTNTNPHTVRIFNPAGRLMMTLHPDPSRMVTWDTSARNTLTGLFLVQMHFPGGEIEECKRAFALQRRHLK
jgi:hypothetical protein